LLEFLNRLRAEETEVDGDQILLDGLLALDEQKNTAQSFSLRGNLLYCGMEK